MARLAVLSYHTSPLAQPGTGDGGGMNVYVRELSGALARLGHEVDVYTRRDNKKVRETVLVEPGFRVHHVTAGPVAELERNLIIERVRAGMRRARLEGRHIGRNPLELDHAAMQRDRSQGQSFRQIAKGHRVSTATVQRVLRQYPIQVLDKTA